MTLSEKFEQLEDVFIKLQNTNSIIEKKDIINNILTELKDDFVFCLEILDGRHKIGYKYYKAYSTEEPVEFNTLKDIHEVLMKPLNTCDLSYDNINKYLSKTSKYAEFLEPLYNREWKLGIGKSLLPKFNTTPMLAKKFEGTVNDIYYITEKLDGNRCIAYYEDNKWNFVSRNGKPIKVDFSMQGLDTFNIYDGEILSPEQVELSEKILSDVLNNRTGTKINTNFNTTSGIINSKYVNKHLIYNIFDIINTSATYETRRKWLNVYCLRGTGDDIRILPILNITNNKDVIDRTLDLVVNRGGEGVMLNSGTALYEQKRTKSILKYKPNYTIDMTVIDIQDGTGKYEGQVGSLLCEAITKSGDVYKCSVGSGLSDEQRLKWTLHPESILGKIIEVDYFSLSQNKLTNGTNEYSLRFPRLKRVREDKNGTSAD